MTLTPKFPLPSRARPHRARGPRRLVLSALVLSAALTGVLFACQVPVFRYALERWDADSYELVIVPRPEFTPAEQEALDFLQDAAGGSRDSARANLRVTLAQPGETILDEAGLPLPAGAMALHYPALIRSFIKKPVWTAELNLENAARIVRSPFRDTLVRRLLEGESAVWLLVESGNREKDDAAEKALLSFAGEAESLLKIPEGVIGPGQLGPPGQPLPPSQAENVLQSEVPLKIDFSVIRLSRDDPAEEVLLGMLLSVEDDLHEYADEPIAFPVFGRGRILEPLVGQGVNRDNFLFASTYLCGACSCEVKEENPGVDLLVAANWDAALQGSEVMIDKVLPPLEGAAALLQASAKDPPPPADSPPPPTPPEKVSKSSPYRTLGIVLGIIVLGILFATLKLKRSAA